jgi:chemotaxis protein MotB
MINFKFTLLWIAAIALLAGCVPNRKYNEMLMLNKQLEEDFRQYKNQYSTSSEENVKLAERNEELRVENSKLRRDIETEQNRYERLQKANEDLNVLYERMLEQNRGMISSTASEKQVLSEELARKQMELDRKEIELRQREADIKDLEATLAQREADVASGTASIAEKQASIDNLLKEVETREALSRELSASLADREQRVNELQNAIAEKENRLRQITGMVNEALRGFSADDLSVREEGGKVYVSLSQNLLFASGRSDIDVKGKDAIKKLADALKSAEDIVINVEGHTDTDGSATNNWDLSVARATTIVKELVRNGVPPEMLIASGRGEHQPVATNNTREGKALNRRTEIILSPRLDLLFDIINNTSGE